MQPSVSASSHSVLPAAGVASATSGLALLQAASAAVSHQLTPLRAPFMSSNAHSQNVQPSVLPPLQTLPPTRIPPDLSALLNPMPPAAQITPPPGFVFGKDGKLKKKRGRKPTPGLSDEQRRQARLLKNRRTAETSRRRKIALMKRLSAERDEARDAALKMAHLISRLHQRLAQQMNLSVNKLLEKEPSFIPPVWPKPLDDQRENVRQTPSKVLSCTPEHSDVSRAPSVAESDEEINTCNTGKASIRTKSTASSATSAPPTNKPQ
ncbi:hypothetical protein BWQ96_00583 [Gracilariopsis chorda]|uniref:BZIP domain-containing protein n=1 Tax=Gracilariopsis chorda TaxID=448386 RepID=A0A2V3J5C4_9FLOR|nr:hypothetical protein BWQ96_00583 [Gracilariopsis chorda]|eukprot:PXF49513.1 hypothetical protein BWQ96_00583 [Gracilariopsis chorda]